MPYNPQVNYQGDRYLFEGIAGAGQALAQGVKQWRANREESQFLDGQAEIIGQLIAPRVAQGAPGADPKVIDDLAKFPGMSLSQKRGKLAGFQFMLDQTQKQEQAAAVQARHDDEMGMRRAGLEIQRGQLLAGDAREQRRSDQEQKRNSDTTAVMLALTGQAPLPSPVNPEAPGAFLQQQYPNADAKVIEGLLKDFTPAAKQRMAIDQGNLDVARDQVDNRRKQIEVQSEQTGRTTLSPSALIDAQTTKAKLRLAKSVAADDTERAAIQADIDQLDALVANSLPAKQQSAGGQYFNPKTRKLETQKPE